MRKIVISVLAALVLSACQTAQPLPTPSGKADVTIAAPVPKIKSLIIAQGMTHGFRVTRDTDYVLQLEKPTQNVAAAVLLGSKYDGIPNERIVFTFAQIGEEVRVLGDIMIVTNPGSAFERITPINTGPAVAGTYSMLTIIKADAEYKDASPPAPAKRATKRS